VILKGLSPLTLNCYIINNKHFVYFKSERVWCECADIFISVHKMSMRPCFACTFYVSFSGRSEFVVLKWSSEVLSFFSFLFFFIVVLIKDIFLLAQPQCSVVAELSVACDEPNVNISYEIAHSYC